MLCAVAADEYAMTGKLIAVQLFQIDVYVKII